jgi:hypothetical protein
MIKLTMMAALHKANSNTVSSHAAAGNNQYKSAGYDRVSFIYRNNNLDFLKIIYVPLQFIREDRTNQPPLSMLQLRPIPMGVD